ncbi:hypothetical protein [Prescottella equi]|uniref:hypothetical protein n=1 Tax=Rhodococcus hoagii TaxID=43767 RepID=UPI00111C73AF|nr:hypothetical protein [Prescottella equi]
MDTVDAILRDMTSIRVRAEQTTVDWERGSEFDVERTPLVDHLVASGGLTVVDSGLTTESDALGIDAELGFAPNDGTPPEETTETVQPAKPASRRRRAKAEDA